ISWKLPSVGIIPRREIDDHLRRAKRTADSRLAIAFRVDYVASCRDAESRHAIDVNDPRSIVADDKMDRFPVPVDIDARAVHIGHRGFQRRTPIDPKIAKNWVVHTGLRPGGIHDLHESVPRATLAERVIAGGALQCEIEMRRGAGRRRTSRRIYV